MIPCLFGFQRPPWAKWHAGGQTWPIDLRGFAAGKNHKSKRIRCCSEWKRPHHTHAFLDLPRGKNNVTLNLAPTFRATPSIATSGRRGLISAWTSPVMIGSNSHSPSRKDIRCCIAMYVLAVKSEKRKATVKFKYGTSATMDLPTDAPEDLETGHLYLQWAQVSLSPTASCRTKIWTCFFTYLNINFVCPAAWQPWTAHRSYLHTITTPNKFVRLFSEGRVFYSQR